MAGGLLILTDDITAHTRISTTHNTAEQAGPVWSCVRVENVLHICYLGLLWKYIYNISDYGIAYPHPIRLMK